MDVIQLFRRIKYAEWVVIILSAVFQLTWSLSSETFDGRHIISLACLVVLFLSAAIPVDRVGKNQRTVLMVTEILLATSAMFFGAHRMYGMLFLVIAGKLAIVLEKRQVLGVALFLVVLHIVAFSNARGHHPLIQVLSPYDRHVAVVALLETQLFFICTTAIALLFGRVLIAELNSRKAAEKLAREIEAMTVAVERSRMARDMHDSIGHTLTSLNIQLELTEKLLTTGDIENAEGALAIARVAARTSLEDVRKTVRSIREEDFSLEHSVNEITDRIGKQQNINFDVLIDDKNLSAPCRHNLLLILQECLTNIQKHSEASLVTIKLSTYHKEAQLIVTDNGKGFKLDGAESGCGLKGLSDRARSLGGIVDIKTKPGNGTAVIVKLPT